MSRIKNILAVTALLASIAAMSNAPTVQARNIQAGTCCPESGSICVGGPEDLPDEYAPATPGGCR